MPPMGVVEALDVLEECGFRLLERIEVGAVDQFRLQGAEEALDHSVVGRGSRRSHAGPQAVGGEDASNQIGCVLTTSIAVMDRARGRHSGADCSPQGGGRELGLPGWP